ncbi:hypothetical protein BDL97_02G167100 [Sphagnum fallax]|nr:hypothetical protein BDL97_02G167100 [Sphagnum fallax]
MGANDSKRISSGAPALDVITTIQRRTAVPQLDPCLERLQQLRVAELGFQIEGVEAVAMKLLQRLNYSASVIKTSAAYLQDVQGLKVEVCEMKAGLNNVLESYEALCKRVEAQGPDFLQGTPGSALRSGT